MLNRFRDTNYFLQIFSKNFLFCRVLELGSVHGRSAMFLDNFTIITDYAQAPLRKNHNMTGVVPQFRHRQNAPCVPRVKTIINFEKSTCIPTWTLTWSTSEPSRSRPSDQTRPSKLLFLSDNPSLWASSDYTLPFRRSSEDTDPWTETGTRSAGDTYSLLYFPQTWRIQGFNAATSFSAKNETKWESLS